jgi:predicted DNA-binding WGR domain protein
MNAVKAKPETSKEDQEDLDNIKAIKEMLKIPMVQKMMYRLECINPSKNEDKFYELWVKPEENGSYCLTSHWGRNGSSGQNKVLQSGSKSLCEAAAEEQYRAKLKKGYRLIKREVVTQVRKTNF